MSKKTKIVDSIGAWELRKCALGFRWQQSPGRYWHPTEHRWCKDAPWSATSEEASSGLTDVIAARRAKEDRELEGLQNELYRLKDSQ